MNEIQIQQLIRDFITSNKVYIFQQYQKSQIFNIKIRQQFEDFSCKRHIILNQQQLITLYQDNHSMDTQRQQLNQRIQEGEVRIKSLLKLNNQLTKIIQHAQISQCNQLLTRLSYQQSSHSQEIHSLKLRISQLQTQLSFSKSRSECFIDQIQTKLEFSQQAIQKLKNQLNKKSQENLQLKRQLLQSKKMIKNQQQLLDQYKKSMEEQKQIQRQISKCEIKEYQTKLNKMMALKIENVKSHYEKIIKKMNQKNIQKQYEKEINHLASFLTSKKNKINNQLSKSKQHNNDLLSSNKQNNSQQHLIYIKQYDQQNQQNQYKHQQSIAYNKDNYQSLQSTLQSKKLFSHYKTNRQHENYIFQGAKHKQKHQGDKITKQKINIDDSKVLKDIYNMNYSSQFTNHFFQNSGLNQTLKLQKKRNKRQCAKQSVMGFGQENFGKVELSFQNQKTFKTSKK